MQEAWKYNRECKLLRDTLQTFSWNGEYHRSFSGELSLSSPLILKRVLMKTESNQEGFFLGNRVSPPVVGSRKMGQMSHLAT